MIVIHVASSEEIELVVTVAVPGGEVEIA